MIPYKKRIASAFSKNALYYDQHAEHQRKCASALAKFFKDAEGPLLEIGCGTGFLTEEIIRRYKSNFTAIDLSDNMVSLCRSKFPQIEVLHRDGELPLGEEKYGAIFSGMCLHWFTDPKKGLANIRKALKPGGHFYFSFPNDRSYPEWDHFPLNRFLNVGLFLEEFGNVDFQEIEFRNEYNSPLDFLREMKQLGVSASMRAPSRLKELIKVSKYGKISITTRITVGYSHV